MKDPLSEIAALTTAATTQPTTTELPGVLLIKGEVPQRQLAAIYEPMIGFVVHGGKTISIGGHVTLCRAPSYFVIPTEIPATGRVHQGANGTPYLSVALRLNHELLADLLAILPPDTQAPAVSAITRFSASPATEDFVDAWLRLLRLLKQPQHIPALAPVYEREILYRVLVGPQGWRLRQLCVASGKASRMRQAVQWIRGHHARPIDIRRIAARAGMAVNTFHRQFKQMTGLSPIQFQKQLRLLEARKLVAYGGHSAAEAAFEVGYESASQFNREYSRFFGAPPARDALLMRKLHPLR